MIPDPRTERLSAYLDGTLSPREKAEVEALLAQDAAARMILNDLKTLRAALKDLPSVKPSEAFYARVWRDIDAAPRRAFWSYAPFKAAGALAAAALVVVVTHDFWRSPAARHTSLLKMAEEAPSPIQMFQEPLEAKQVRRDQPLASDRREKDQALGIDQVASRKLEKNENSFSQPSSGLGEAGGALPRGVVFEKLDAPAAPPDKEKKLPSLPRLKIGVPVLDEVQEARKRMAKTMEAPPAGFRAGALPPEPAAPGEAEAPASSAAGRGADAAPEALASLSDDDKAAPRKEVASIPLDAFEEWQGDQSGEKTRRLKVVKDARDWEDLWRLHQGEGRAPAVDFKTRDVVAVFSGQQSTGGHSIQILSVSIQGDAVVVVYRESAPSAGAVVTQALTSPFHIRVVAKTALPVRFKKSR